MISTLVICQQNRRGLKCTTFASNDGLRRTPTWWPSDAGVAPGLLSAAVEIATCESARRLGRPDAAIIAGKHRVGRVQRQTKRALVAHNGGPVLISEFLRW